MKKFLIFAFSLVSSVFLASLTSYNSFAADSQLLGDDWYLVRSSASYPSCSVNSTSAYMQHINNPITLGVGGSLWISCKDSAGADLSANNNDIVVLEMLSSQALGVNWYNTSARYLFSDYSAGNSDSNFLNFGTQTFYYLSSGFSRSVEFSFVCDSGGMQTYNQCNFAPLSINIYRSKVSKDYEQVLNDIKNSLNSQSNSINSIDSGVRSLNNTMNSLNENEGRVADVAEDEYNQTMEDRDNASSDANGFAFNFNIPNPFSIFQVSDGCVNTPTIDSWLHLQGDWVSPHCPVIPAEVRNTLTPIVTLIVSLASLMVVIRWVSSSNVGVSSDIGQSSDSSYSNALVAKANADKIRRLNNG